MCSNIRQVFDQFDITHAVVRDVTITFTSDIPADMIDELAHFLKTPQVSEEEEEEDMFVADDDDLVNVTIARIIRQSHNPSCLQFIGKIR